MAMDNAGRVTRAQGIDGLTEISYDGTSKRPATVERNGAVTTLGYDDNGLLVRSEDADGYTVEVTRNPAGLPVRVSDGLLDQRFTYDEAGRPVTEGHGARQAKARYDQDGRPLEITDRAGHQLQPAYDSTGRLTGIGGGAGSGTAADDLAVLANGLGAVLGGDEPGVGEVTVQAIVGGKGEPQTYTYTNGDQAQFDSWGRLLSVTVDGRTTSRTYDQAGRLTTLTVPGNQTYRLSYSPAGRVATVSDGTVEATLTWHGDLLTRAETSAGSTYTYNYDTEGRLTTATVGDLAWSYRYDPTGLVTLVARPTGSTYYQWDDLGRPVRMVETGVDERYVVRQRRRPEDGHPQRRAGSDDRSEPSRSGGGSSGCRVKRALDVHLRRRRNPHGLQPAWWVRGHDRLPNTRREQRPKSRFTDLRRTYRAMGLGW